MRVQVVHNNFEHAHKKNGGHTENASGKTEIHRLTTNACGLRLQALRPSEPTRLERAKGSKSRVSTHQADHGFSR